MTSFADNCTFGVEIECFIPTDAFNGTGMSDPHYQGSRIGDDAYTCDPATIVKFADWKYKSDSSLTRSPYDAESWQQPQPEDTVAVEFVSPILRGLDGLESIKAICSWIQSLGGSVNNRCGLHIHIGFSYSNEVLRNLIWLFSNHENAFWAVSGCDRKRNGFCESVRSNVSPVQPESVHSGLHHRYFALNVSNLTLTHSRKRTVEFRCFSGSVCGLEIVARLFLAMGLVEKSMGLSRLPQWESDFLKRKNGIHDPNAKNAVHYGNGGKRHCSDDGDGLAEIERLMLSLGWKQSKKSKQLGMVDPSLLAVVRNQLRILARQYDLESSASPAFALV